MRGLQILPGMKAKGEKDGWGDTLRAAERAREDLYFAKIDEQLIEKIRRAEPSPQGDPGESDLGRCPRCKEALRSGLWRNLTIEFCAECGGVWLDQGDLLDLADRRDVSLHLSERGGVEPR